MTPSFHHASSSSFLVIPSNLYVEVPAHIGREKGEKNPKFIALFSAVHFGFIAFRVFALRSFLFFFARWFACFLCGIREPVPPLSQEHVLTAAGWRECDHDNQT